MQKKITSGKMSFSLFAFVAASPGLKETCLLCLTTKTEKPGLVCSYKPGHTACERCASYGS